MNSIHTKYCTEPTYNTLDDMFELLERFPAEDRDTIMGWPYEYVINSKYRRPRTGEEKIADLAIEKSTYENFKNKCLQISKLLPEPFLVRSIIQEALTWGYFFADEEQTGHAIENLNKMVANITDELVSTEDEDKKQTLFKMKTFCQTKLDNIETDRMNHKNRYDQFCEIVVLELLRKSKAGLYKGIAK